VQSSVSKNVILNGTKFIEFNNKEVDVQQNSSSRMNNEKFLGYELSTSDLGVLIEKIEQVDDVGKVLKILTRFKVTDTITFEVSENNIQSSIHLKFTYKPLKQKSILIDQKFGIGL